MPTSIKSIEAILRDLEEIQARSDQTRASLLDLLENSDLGGSEEPIQGTLTRLESIQRGVSEVQVALVHQLPEPVVAGIRPADRQTCAESGDRSSKAAGTRPQPAKPVPSSGEPLPATSPAPAGATSPESPLGEREIRREQAQEIQKYKDEVDSLLAKAADARQKGVYEDEVVRLYKQAEHVATAAAATYPDAFVGLPERAARERLQYERLGLFPLLALIGHYRQLLVDLDAMDPSWNVIVYSRGLSVGLLPVPEARRHYQTEAYNWVMNKTPEKIEEARQALWDAHSPDTALKVLTDFQLLVAGLMPDPERIAIEEVITTEIEPAQQRRREAIQLLREVEAMPMSQVTQAWEKILAATDMDPFAPGLEELLEKIGERLRVYTTMQPEGSGRSPIHYPLQEEIETAQCQAKARRLLQEAKPMPESQVVQAWEKMQSAKNLDPTVPDLEWVRGKLLKRLRGYVEWQLAKSNRSWVDAQKELGELEKNSQERMGYRRRQACSRLRQADEGVIAALEAAALDDSLGDLHGQAEEMSLRIRAALRDQEKSEDIG